MLSFEEAHARVLALASSLGAERVGLDDASDRVLAAPVLAPDDMPAFDYSAMDGYAVDATALAGAAPLRLPVRGESQAGRAPPELARGSACRIFTGAPLPKGADAVVMQEHVEREGDVVVLREAPRSGAHVRRRGEDLANGATAIAAGTRLRPAHVALAAACDKAWLEVSRRPVVAIVGTGNELRAPGQSATRDERARGLIPESNGPAIRAMAARAGAHARLLVPAKDDRAALVGALDVALCGVDLLVTIGGVSVGDYDLVHAALVELGAQIELWNVAIKPGKPLLAGRRGGARILGLPGNPTSAMVTFALFGVPLLRAMQGDARPMPASVRARLSCDVRHQPGRLEFLRVTIRSDPGGLVATPLANQSSGAPLSMASAEGLACLEASRAVVSAGEAVEVLRLDELGA